MWPLIFNWLRACVAERAGGTELFFSCCRRILRLYSFEGFRVGRLAGGGLPGLRPRTGECVSAVRSRLVRALLHNPPAT